MKLTRATDYAIRILTHLAASGREATSASLSKELAIPFNHIVKVIQVLAQHGFLLTKKGKTGGLKLNLDPTKIILYDIVKKIEGPIILSDCILHHQNCEFGKGCKTRKHLSSIRNKMEEMFSAVTIADLASKV